MNSITYRTISKAGNVATIPNSLAIITNPVYSGALNLSKEGKAYLQPIESKEGLNISDLTIKDGRLFFNGVPATTAKLKSIYSDEVPEIDLAFLQLCYSIMLHNFKQTIIEDKTVNEIINIYVPEFYKAIGRSSNISSRDTQALIDKILSYQSIIGIISKGAQPVLVYMGEDRDKNVISFSSPYLVKIIQLLYEVSIRRDKKGDPLLARKGTARTLPTHSYLIKTSIESDKCKRAITNVQIIVSLIEQAGNNVAHIKASTIIDRNPQLKASLEGKSASRKNSILKKVFKKTWQLLEKETHLKDVYKNIVLPSPDSSGSIPTSSKLNMVFNFPHEGKASYA